MQGVRKDADSLPQQLVPDFISYIDGLQLGENPVDLCTDPAIGCFAEDTDPVTNMEDHCWTATWYLATEILLRPSLLLVLHDWPAA